jgi:hypothetical protein
MSLVPPSSESPTFHLTNHSDGCTTSIAVGWSLMADLEEGYGPRVISGGRLPNRPYSLKRSSDRCGYAPIGSGQSRASMLPLRESVRRTRTEQGQEDRFCREVTYEEVRSAVGGGTGIGLNRLGPPRGYVLHQFESDDVQLGELGSVPQSVSRAKPVSDPESMPHTVSWSLLAQVVVLALWWR